MYNDESAKFNKQLIDTIKSDKTTLIHYTNAHTVNEQIRTSKSDLRLTHQNFYALSHHSHAFNLALMYKQPTQVILNGFISVHGNMFLSLIISYVGRKFYNFLARIMYIEVPNNSRSQS